MNQRGTRSPPGCTNTFETAAASRELASRWQAGAVSTIANVQARGQRFTMRSGRELPTGVGLSAPAGTFATAIRPSCTPAIQTDFGLRLSSASGSVRHRHVREGKTVASNQRRMRARQFVNAGQDLRGIRP